MTRQITLDHARQVLHALFGGHLDRGGHGAFVGRVCVRELAYVCRHLEEPPTRDALAALSAGWTDCPDGESPTDRACQILNDADWSGPAARTDGCLPLVLLAEEDAPAGWARHYAEATVRVILPMALERAATLAPPHATALRVAARSCAERGTARAAWEAFQEIGKVPSSVARLRGASQACVASIHAARGASVAAAAHTVTWVAGMGPDPDSVLRAGVAVMLASHRSPRPWDADEVLAAVRAWEVRNGQ